MSRCGKGSKRTRPNLNSLKVLKIFLLISVNYNCSKNKIHKPEILYTSNIFFCRRHCRNARIPHRPEYSIKPLFETIFSWNRITQNFQMAKSISLIQMLCLKIHNFLNFTGILPSIVVPSASGVTARLVREGCSGGWGIPVTRLCPGGNI